VETLVQDVRFTLRHMAKHAGLSTVIALSLALGIGANTAIFSLIRGVVLRGLPVHDPERLVLLYWGADIWPEGLVQSGSGGPRAPAGAARADRCRFLLPGDRERSRALLSHRIRPLGASRENVTLPPRAGERVKANVSGSYVPVSASRPRMDDVRRPTAGGAAVAVLSHAYWVRRLPRTRKRSVARSPSTICRTPVGVARQGFFGVQPGRRPDVWIPFVDAPQLAPWGYRPADARSLLTTRDYWWVQVMARLKDGADARQTEAAADAMFRRFVGDALPSVDSERPPHIGIEPGAAGLDLSEAATSGRYVLMGMVGIVLLIACANVAVLRCGFDARRREFALRLSLGARAPPVRQLLTESLIMATAGGLLRLLFAGWTSRGLLLAAPPATHPTTRSTRACWRWRRPFRGDGAAAVSCRARRHADRSASALKQSASGTVAADHPAHRIWYDAGRRADRTVADAGRRRALFVRTINHLCAQPLGVEQNRLLVFGMDASQNGARRRSARRGLCRHAAAAQALPVSSRPPREAAPVLRMGQQRPDHRRGNNRTRPTCSSSAAVGPDLPDDRLTVLAGRDVTWDDINGAGASPS
jgi:hypothetical protein